VTSSTVTYPEEVSQAFLSGEESIVVWTMKCVGYDVDFQQNLVEKLPTYVPKTPGQKGSKPKNTKAPRTSKKESTAKVGQKRKHVEVESSDEELDGDTGVAHEDEDSDFDEEVLVYRSRGTRSRPIRI